MNYVKETLQEKKNITQIRVLKLNRGLISINNFYNHLTGKSIHYKIKLTKNPHEYEDYPRNRRFLAAIRGEERPSKKRRLYI